MSSFKRDLARVYAAGAIGLVCVAVAITALVSRSTRDCPHVVQERIVAPDSAYEAIVWGYGCGWATKGSTMVGIGDPGGAPTSAAHAVGLMDADGAHLLLDRAQRPQVDVRWEGPDTVVIRYSRSAKMLGRNAEAYGIYLRYEVEP